MKIFCLVYPDAVHSAHSVGIAENIVRSGAKIVSSTTRLLDEEEARLVFTSRRYSADYFDFCKAMTVSAILLLHIEVDKIETIFQYLSPDQTKEIFIPLEVSTHKVLLKLGDDLGYTKEKLPGLIGEMRKRIAKTEDQSSRQFAAAATVHASKMFTYYVSMQVAGFTDKEAFELTKSMHDWLLFEQGDDDDEPKETPSEEDD